MRDKEKAKAYHTEWRKKNKAHLLKYQAEDRAKNSAAIKRRRAKWEAANPGKMAEHRARWDAANLEAYKPRKLELARKRYKENPLVRDKSIAASSRYARENPEWAKRKHRQFNLRNAYGITPAVWEGLFEQQGRRCRICRSDKSAGKGFHTDHCHTTDRIRGILCSHCNLMLGHAKDNIAILEAAINYLKEVAA